MTTASEGMVGKLMRRLRHVFPNGRQQRVALPANFHPISERLPEDILIAGYPKSGNTWFQYLAAATYFGVSLDHCPDLLIQELVPDVHFKTFYKRFGPVMCFKTHDLPQANHRRVVYLLRDGRDVMVSYFHHQNALTPGRYSFKEMIETGVGLYPCKWHEHVHRWQQNPHGAEILVVKYEDLHADPVKQLCRFCEFANLKRERAFLETVAASAHFSKMQKKEKTQGWDNNTWPKDKSFVRRGQVGSHADEFPADCLKRFQQEAGSLLAHYGYQ